MIQNFVPGSVVLDLFAGSGALGLEALSNGASKVILCDNNKTAISTMRDNSSGMDGVCILETDYKRYLKETDLKFDVIFLDPPYRENFLIRAINAICDIDILTDGGIIVCESMREAELPVTNAPYIKGREYLYGKSKITVYRKEMQ